MPICMCRSSLPFVVSFILPHEYVRGARYLTMKGRFLFFFATVPWCLPTPCLLLWLTGICRKVSCICTLLTSFMPQVFFDQVPHNAISLSTPRLYWSCHNPPKVSRLTSGGALINTTSGVVYSFLHRTNKIISAALELCSLTQASGW